MSRGTEHKRVSLTTVFQGETAFSRFGSNFLEPEVPAAIANSGNKPAKTAKSIRIKLELFESDSNKYPEFNYTRLLYLEKKKAKKLKQVSTCNGPGSDPFADNDDDVARIVKELEAKYGNSYATGRGKSKKDEYRDIGMGYDESDSFIDNTEAYDEIIPKETETQEGGFFINKGIVTLKSKQKSYTTRTDAIIKMPERSRKRVVCSESSSSSSSDEDDDENEDNEGEDEGEGEEEESDSEETDESDSEEDDSDSESLEDEDSAATVKFTSKYKDNHHPSKRPKVIVTGKPKSSSSSSVDNKKLPKKPTVTSSSSNSPRPIVIDNSDTDERHGQIPGPIQSQAQAQAQALKKVVKTTTVKDMLKAKRDSFLKSQSSPSAVKSVGNGELKCISTDVESSSGSSDTDSATEQGKADRQAGKQAKEGPENLRSADTLLPASLDPDILAAVNSLKDEVRSRDMCGSRFRLDDKLTPLLLRVYEAVLCTDRNERNMVFSHIEYQLQLPKYYILRKGKAVRAKEEKNKSRKSIEKLRQAVAMVMPKAIANYEMELRNFAEQGAADVNSELPPKMPRKKFQWTSELRQLLYDVYQARWTSYAVLAKRKDSLEEFINGYLKVKVVDLWPTGWMRYDELQREITRHKTASRKSKEKPIASSMKPADALEQLPQGSHYPKTVEEPRSRGNSDTDSATSASSNSLKRKLQDQAKATCKPPKKKVAKQVPQQSPQPQSFQLTPTATAAVSVPAAINNNHLPPHLDTLLSMPSTSAQAAVLNAAAVASASPVLDLASPNRKAAKAASPHSNFIKVISPAILAPNGTPRQSPIGGQAKVIVAARPSAHVINLDDYQCPSEILQTSKQLAATSVITSTSKAAQTTPVSRVSRDSSSESDGVEFVGIYPAWKPVQNALSKPKVKTQKKTLGASGNVGFSNKNMYVYNNSNSASGLGGAMYNLSHDSQIIKAMSDLKALENTIKWPTQSIFSPSSVKGGAGGGAMGSPGTGSSSRQ
ncbi:yemanuclein [Drosophila kikkawai]|uniref:Yemanuclein n=1 Tax=Drosophila kikkawai TaxID=30033 RepID=A0A6P4HQ15_DROKI|nr:yemanuclein [Drosophila kikkawai]